MAIDFHLKLSPSVRSHFNFFRIHVLFFTFVPLVASGIFYAANGSTATADTQSTERQKVTYTDSLFLCYSAMTVTGLVTINVSAIHPFQQAILFVLFIIGDYSVVSLVMVLVRKRFFRSHCIELLQNDHLRRTSTTATNKVSSRKLTLWSTGVDEKRERRGKVISSPSNARPIQDIIEERIRTTSSPKPMTPGEGGPRSYIYDASGHFVSDVGNGNQDTARDPFNDSSNPSSVRGASGTPANLSHSRLLTQPSSGASKPFPRENTIHIVEPVSKPEFDARQRLRFRARSMSVLPPHDVPSIPRQPTFTVPAPPSHPAPPPVQPHYSGFGGFPSPVQLLAAAIPSSTRDILRHRIARADRRMSLTVPASLTMNNRDEESAPTPESEESWSHSMKMEMAKWMPENLGGLVIGRNSRFYTEELPDDELEKLGGVEYRALRLLGYFVGSYIFLFMIVPFAVMAIYLSQERRWDSAFQASPGVQAGTVNRYWTSLFFSVTAYTGAGFSLIDQSMVPFASCYLLIYVLNISMLAGNHALPMMLRFMIWVGTKFCAKGQTHETLHFLLDHPRRCFLYLFPSHQTWYLVLTLVAFIVVEMFAFLVLSIDLPVLSGIHSGWQLFSDGLLQSLSVRASGFGIISVASLAPSVLFLYVILMYVAVYPIAMSVRSTNVYEERALGVYEPENVDYLQTDTEPEFKGQRAEVFSRYLLWHMRRQLAFDIWPLTLAIFLICIAERGKILDPNTSAWFTVFRIMFECTSAYGTIGLSMGTPNNNYSFSGEFSTVSKLIVMLVMLRGRHRGLPVAIDRAILLPTEYTRIDQKAKAGGEAGGQVGDGDGNGAEKDKTS